MNPLKEFEHRTLKNYIIGSFIAVFGIGSIFIFSTLSLTSKEIFILLAIMLLSACIMAACEYLVYSHHIKPIKEIFSRDTPSFKSMEKAYVTAHQFPRSTVKRIMGPHLFGLSLPASIICYFAIQAGYLSMPYYFIALAWFGAFLIAVMHALIEFFLTYRSVQPLIDYLSIRTKQMYGKEHVLEERHFFSIKKKLLFSSILIATFPILLFTLASAVQINKSHTISTESYWNWALLILFVILFLAIFCSLLLHTNIQKPIESLKHRMMQIKDGKLELLENVYSDEFSHLVTGFNHMVNGIKDRDARNDQLIDSFFTVFAATLDARDPYTAGHSIRVAEYAVIIAEEAGLSAGQVELLRKSALLHDIGKIGVKDAVLLKEGRLTDDEFEEIKKHPVIGANILEQVNLPEELQPLLPGVKYHHERYDGKGYPEGLIGNNIPLFGRIMAVADAYDAMTSDRPYRKGMPADMALKIISDGKGTQWDPQYAELFIQYMRKEVPLNEENTG